MKLNKMDSFDKNHECAPLTNEETRVAMESLFHPAKSWPQIKQKFVDPIVRGEPQFALFSFAKSKGATPDEKGFLGVAKIRGSFFSEKEASERAEMLIRETDSTNSIFTCVMGMPFPLVDKGHAEELDEIDLSKKTELTIAENIREKRKKEEKEMKEIRERHDALLKKKDDDTDDREPEEIYGTERVKLANLCWLIREHSKKIQECKPLAEECLKSLKEKSALNPEFESKFSERYAFAREKAHFKEDNLPFFIEFLKQDLENITI